MRHGINGSQTVGRGQDLDGDGIFETSGAIATGKYTQPGTYTVTLKVVDGHACTAYDSLTVTASKKPGLEP